MKGRSSNTWCSEDAVSWFIVSILRSKGFWLVLGLGDDKFVVLSKSELKPLARELGENFIQGRHRVDVAAYNEDTFIMGIVISRMIPLTLRVNTECCKASLFMVLGSPKTAIEAYQELRRRGFNFASMNVARFYKLLRSIETSGRFKRVSEGKKTVGLAIVLGLNVVKNYAVEALKDLNAYLRSLGKEIPLALYVFKPVDLSSGPPTTVELTHVWGQKVIEPGTYGFSEVMGVEWIGCRKCKYLSTCIQSFY